MNQDSVQLLVHMLPQVRPRIIWAHCRGRIAGQIGRTRTIDVKVNPERNQRATHEGDNGEIEPSENSWDPASKIKPVGG